jgi:hypothetical protein
MQTQSWARAAGEFHLLDLPIKAQRIIAGEWEHLPVADAATIRSARIASNPSNRCCTNENASDRYTYSPC